VDPRYLGAGRRWRRREDAHPRKGNDTAPRRDPFTKFSGKIRLPKRCRSATLEIDVHADNDVTLSLNGVVFGAQPAGPLLPNFQGPPEHHHEWAVPEEVERSRAHGPG
jgi:hypothetical protein